MVDFDSKDELRKYLAELHPSYACHATVLWDKKYRHSDHLANADKAVLLSPGLSDADVDDIKFKAASGKSQACHKRSNCMQGLSCQCCYPQSAHLAACRGDKPGSTPKCQFHCSLHPVSFW